MAPQLTRRNGPCARARPLVDRPGHDLLARPRLAQNQHRRVRGGDQLDLLHHRLEAGLGADDRIADVVPVQSRQERPVVRLDGLAQRDQLAEAMVILQGHRERLDSSRMERLMFFAEEHPCRATMINGAQDSLRTARWRTPGPNQQDLKARAPAAACG